MARSTGFQSCQPLVNHRSLDLQHHRVSGPFSFLNPTRAAFKHVPTSDPELHGEAGDTGDYVAENGNEDQTRKDDKCGPSKPGDDEQLASNIEFKWRSRDNRKGRHTLVVDPSVDPSAAYIVPKTSSALSQIVQGVLRMLTQFPYWDISWLVAVIFTLGSCVWVINAFFVWLPLVQPSTEFNNEILVGGGVTAFIGATIFELGSILLMFEAFNENREGCFGWALEEVVGDTIAKRIRVRPDKDGCRHHHTNKKNLLGKGTVKGSSASVQSSIDSPQDVEKNDAVQSTGRTWVWIPSWHDLTTHYFRELGFLASLSQFCGATIFWISGFTALPGINDNLSSQALLDGVYWTPQIVGGTGFIVSGTLYMLETQEKWYKPAFGVLGWHIAFWNLIGAFGFTLCGALGPAYGNSGAQYEASLATFWGSWAFLIGSSIQWYESLDKNPVELATTGPDT